MVDCRKQKSPRFASRQLLSFLIFEYFFVPSENQTASSLTRMHRPRSHFAPTPGTVTPPAFKTWLIKSTTKNAARMPQINERNRLPWSALRCHRDRLSTVILAPFLAVA